MIEGDVMVRIYEKDDTIKINGSLTAENVSETEDLLSLYIPGRDEVKIELSGLEGIDAAGAYMLLILKLKSVRSGQRLSFLIQNPLMKLNIDQQVPHLFS